MWNKKLNVITVSLIVLFLLPIAFAAELDPSVADYTKTHRGNVPVILTYDEYPESAISDSNAIVTHRFDDTKMVSLDVPYNQLSKFVSDKNVKKIFLDESFKLDDPKQESQPLDLFNNISLYNSVSKMNVPYAWNLNYTGKGVKVAVLDTGIDSTHPDLVGKVIASKDFTFFDGVNDTHDYNGHGTHVAGIIASSGMSMENMHISVDEATANRFANLPFQWQEEAPFNQPILGGRLSGSLLLYGAVEKQALEVLSNDFTMLPEYSNWNFSYSVDEEEPESIILNVNYKEKIVLGENNFVQYNEDESSHGLYYNAPYGSIKYRIEFEGNGLPLDVTYHSSPVLKMLNESYLMDAFGLHNGLLTLYTGNKMDLDAGESYITEDGYTITFDGISYSDELWGENGLLTREVWYADFTVTNAQGAHESFSIRPLQGWGYFEGAGSVYLQVICQSCGIDDAEQVTLVVGKKFELLNGESLPFDDDWIIDDIHVSMIDGMRHLNYIDAVYNADFEGNEATGLKQGVVIDGPKNSSGLPLFNFDLAGMYADFTGLRLQKSEEGNVINAAWYDTAGNISYFGPTSLDNFVTNAAMSPGDWTIINGRSFVYSGQNMTEDNNYYAIFYTHGNQEEISQTTLTPDPNGAVQALFDDGTENIICTLDLLADNQIKIRENEDGDNCNLSYIFEFGTPDLKPILDFSGFNSNYVNFTEPSADYTIMYSLEQTGVRSYVIGFNTTFIDTTEAIVGEDDAYHITPFGTIISTDQVSGVTAVNFDIPYQWPDSAFFVQDAINQNEEDRYAFPFVYSADPTASFGYKTLQGAANTNEISEAEFPVLGNGSVIALVSLGESQFTEHFKLQDKQDESKYLDIQRSNNEIQQVLVDGVPVEQATFEWNNAIVDYDLSYEFDSGVSITLYSGESYTTSAGYVITLNNVFLDVNNNIVFANILVVSPDNDEQQVLLPAETGAEFWGMTFWDDLNIHVDTTCTSCYVREGVAMGQATITIANVVDVPHVRVMSKSDNIFILSDETDFSSDPVFAISGGSDFASCRPVSATLFLCESVPVMLKNFEDNTISIAFDFNLDGQPDSFKGVAPDAKLINAKVVLDWGNFLTSDALAGIDWAVQQDADVISMSLGSFSSAYWFVCDGTDPLSQMVGYAESKGVTVVVAAGNSGQEKSIEAISQPACSQAAITVGASDSVSKSNFVASFSSSGPTTDSRIKPDIIAPGVEILSTISTTSLLSLFSLNNYLPMSGTSMAAPHVSGLVALMKEAHPELFPDQIKNILKTTTTDYDLPSEVQGSGEVNAARIFSNMTSRASVSEINLRVPVGGTVSQNFTTTPAVTDSELELFGAYTELDTHSFAGELTSPNQATSVLIYDRSEQGSVAMLDVKFEYVSDRWVEAYIVDSQENKLSEFMLSEDYPELNYKVPENVDEVYLAVSVSMNEDANFSGSVTYFSREEKNWLSLSVNGTNLQLTVSPDTETSGAYYGKILLETIEGTITIPLSLIVYQIPEQNVSVNIEGVLQNYYDRQVFQFNVSGGTKALQIQGEAIQDQEICEDCTDFWLEGPKGDIVRPTQFDNGVIVPEPASGTWHMFVRSTSENIVEFSGSIIPLNYTPALNYVLKVLTPGENTTLDLGFKVPSTYTVTTNTNFIQLEGSDWNWFSDVYYDANDGTTKINVTVPQDAIPSDEAYQGYVSFTADASVNDVHVLQKSYTVELDIVVSDKPVGAGLHTNKATYGVNEDVVIDEVLSKKLGYSIIGDLSLAINSNNTPQLSLIYPSEKVILHLDENYSSQKSWNTELEKPGTYTVMLNYEYNLFDVNIFGYDEIVYNDAAIATAQFVIRSVIDAEVLNVQVPASTALGSGPSLNVTIKNIGNTNGSFIVLASAILSGVQKQAQAAVSLVIGQNNTVTIAMPALSSAGTYSLTIEVRNAANNEIVDAVGASLVVVGQASSGGGGGGGGGGAAPPAASGSAVSMSASADAATDSIKLKLENKRAMLKTFNLKVTEKGDYIHFDFTVPNVKLIPLQKSEVAIQYKLRPFTRPGKYSVEIVVNDPNGDPAKQTVEITLPDIPWSTNSVGSQRYVDANADTMNIALALHNPYTEAKEITITETIPKSVASSVDGIQFALQPVVINPDPVVSWTFMLKSGETKELTYKVKANASTALDFSSPVIEEIRTVEKGSIELPGAGSEPGSTIAGAFTLGVFGTYALVGGLVVIFVIVIIVVIAYSRKTGETSHIKIKPDKSYKMSKETNTKTENVVVGDDDNQKK